MTQTASTEFPALDSDPIDKLAIDTIRTLCMDAVQAANSGHPGTPMALAPVMYTVWQNFLRFDPGAPIWSNRDRSSCRPGTRQRSSTRCCTWPG